ncbi:MAG: sulfatase, partial [Phycisphaerales bacterium]
MRGPCKFDQRLLYLAVLLLGITPVDAQTNVVLFVVDDLGWADNDLGYSEQFAQQRGDTDAFFETPNLRAMAAQGASFTQAYTSSPICSPTRASLMLGQSPARHRVTQFIGGPDAPGFSYLRSLPATPTTVAEALRDAGYRTGYAGKWHLGSLPTQHGFQSNFGGGSQGLPSSWFANANGGFAWANGLPDDGPAFAGEYLTDRLTRDAVDFINESVGAGEPFFLDLSHYGVHVPFAAPQALIDKYTDKLANGNYAKFNSLTASQRQEVATYAAMVESVDQSLGTVRAALVAAGVADDTLMVFTSDNGGLATPDFGNFAAGDMNAPLRNGKGTLYEGGVRVPMIAAGPGVIPGDRAGPVISHDLFPTFLSAAGVTLPGQAGDGVDLTPALAGGPAPDRGDKPVLIHYPHVSNQGGRPGGALIQGDWKIIQSYEHGGIELYNLANDLGETTDLESTELARVERMRVELHTFLAATAAQVPTGFSKDTRHAGVPVVIGNHSFEGEPLPDNVSGDPGHPDERTPGNWAWVGGVELSNGGLANPNAGTLFGPDFPGTDGAGTNGAMDG